ncbi:MAG TPA: DUF2272 domain-containing protein [Thermoanaerobaculia bacterium]
MPSAYERKLATVAQQQHDDYHMEHESDPKLAKQIQKYWTDLGFAFPGVGEAWSAVFVSWCVRKAGASKQEFPGAIRHSQFVHWAIQNKAAQTGLFWGYDINSYAPQVGDIIQNNRVKANKFTFNYASKHANYKSHSAIVVEVGEDASGRYALTIGGNESDSIRRTVVRLDASGYVVQRKVYPFIAIVEIRK